MYLGILDVMLINSFLGWNNSVQSIHGRQRLARYDFMTYISERMMCYKEIPIFCSPRCVTNGQRNVVGDSANNPDDHFPIASKTKTKCTVCRLELHMNKRLGHGNLTRSVATCLCCGVHAHSCVLIDSNRQIHKLPLFVNLSCFEIMHCSVGYEIWPRSNAPNAQKRLYPKQDHSVVKQLREFHNVSRKNRRDRGNSGS